MEILWGILIVVIILGARILPALLWNDSGDNALQEKIEKAEAQKAAKERRLARLRESEKPAQQKRDVSAAK